MTTYVFVFLGEFGYEVLNWQGVVRKLRRLDPDAIVVCASRGSVHPLYEPAEYVEIGDVPEFRESMAIGYYAVQPGDEHIDSDANVALDAELRRVLRRAITDRLRERWGWRLAARRLRGMRIVFSSDRTAIGECIFGADRRLFGAIPAEGSIYDQMDHRNNLYAPIAPDLSQRAGLEERLGFSLDEPYVLIQGRRRDTAQRSSGEIDQDRLIGALAERGRVVLADFSTGRAHDSYSRFDLPDVHRVELSAFPEQSCLIHSAAACVFLTEGDFGSHMYIPPLLGRDVWSVAPGDVYELGTTPIDIWNHHVFRWGGGIRPVRAEQLTDPARLADFCDDIARHLSD